jgi:hypothetical protein
MAVTTLRALPARRRAGARRGRWPSWPCSPSASSRWACCPRRSPAWSKPGMLLCLVKPRRLRWRVGESAGELAGDGALERSADLFGGASFGPTARDVVAMTRSGWWDIRVSAIDDRARLRRRSPPRSSRRRVVAPEEAGIGQVPVIAARAASEWIRPRWDQAVSTTAALTAPTPGSLSSCAASLASTNVVSWRRLSWSSSSPVSDAAGRPNRLTARGGRGERLAPRSHAAIVAICWFDSGLRASTPRSTVRTSAVRALLARVRSRPMPSMTIRVSRSPPVPRPTHASARLRPAAVAGKVDVACTAPVRDATAARVWVLAWASTR